MALAEILFPHTWHNTPEDMRSVAFQWMAGGQHGTDKGFKNRKIPLGFYGVAEELVDAIDSLKPRDFKGIGFYQSS